MRLGEKRRSAWHGNLAASDGGPSESLSGGQGGALAVRWLVGPDFVTWGIPGQVFAANVYTSLRRVPAAVCRDLLGHLGFPLPTNLLADWCASRLLGIGRSTVRRLWNRLTAAGWQPLVQKQGLESSAASGVFCGRPAARPDGARPGGYPRLRQGRYGEGLPGRHSARSPRGSPRRDKVQSPLVHGLGGALGGRLLPRLVGGCASPAIARLGHSVRPIAGLGRRQHWWHHVVAPGNLLRPWRGLLRRGRAHPVPPRRHALRKFAEGRPGSGQFGLGVFAGPPCWLVV